ncbi:MAG: glycosyltransferase family 2 protein [Pseudomonadales bacterium]
MSIIVPTHNRLDLLEPCVGSIRARTEYTNYEILVVDHASDDAATLDWLNRNDGVQGVRVIRYRGPFNWSAINNAAVRKANGELLCFLNNDTEVLRADWLTEMVAQAMQPGVGAVGAKLLFPNSTVQHAGVVVGAHGIADHAFTGLSADDAGYLARAAVTSEVSAVTGACMLVSRPNFDAVGGFNAVDLPVAYNDVDFCLRLQDAGKRNVFTPHAVLLHHAGQSRGGDLDVEDNMRLHDETNYMQRRWRRVLAADPHYSVLFERYETPYQYLSAANTGDTEQALPEPHAKSEVPEAPPVNQYKDLNGKLMS